MSRWLEDWDSVQFALALNDFSLEKHQPHAPGYPIYILFGKGIDFFLQNETRALTFLSALFGALGVVMIYILTKKLFDKKTALASAVILMFIPVHWMLSEVALTNIPGLFFLTLIAYLSYQAGARPKLLPPTAVLAGFALGVRFTELPVILSLLAIPIILQKKLRVFLTSLVAFIFGVLLWTTPMALINGFNNTIEAYTWIGNYVIKHDAQLGQANYTLNIISTRLSDLSYLLKIAYTPFLLIIFFIAVIWATKEKLWVKKPYLFLWVWLLSYLLPLAFVFNLEVARYTLPLAPPIAILTASLITKNAKGVVLILLAGALILVLLHEGISQVTRFYKTIPPTITPVLWVKENFKPNETKIITTFTYRQFEYYAKDFTNFYGETPDEDAKSRYIIIDFLGLKDNVDPKNKYAIINQKTFEEAPDIFNRISRVNLYILERRNEDK